MRSTRISPSLLAADFAHLVDEIEMINSSEAYMLHLDIMDGEFVPNISFGFPVLKSVSEICKKPLDCHFMVVHPERWVQKTAQLGARYMNVHFEATRHLNRVLAEIRDAGMKPAVTLNPSTPVSMLEDVIQDVDMVLLMSVNPGFGGQKLIENTYAKIGRLRRLIAESSSNALIEVDGGVNAATAPKLVEAGADVLVSGSYIFKAANPLETIKQLKNL